MKHIITIAIVFIAITKLSAQIPYADPLALAATSGELAAAEGLRSAKAKTTAEWAKSAITSIIENKGRYRLRTPIRRIHFFKYTHVCGIYVNPTKTRKCTKKMTFIKKTHDAVYDFLLAQTKHEINTGVGDQIWEKYASICEILTKELEAEKTKAEKIYRLLNYLEFKG